MVKRQNNQLPEHLPQLQNLIKKDAESYREEFLQQFQHFQNTLEAFQLSPNERNKTLENLVMFMAQVAHCYPKELEKFPQQIVDLLDKHNTVFHNETRMVLCRALILLRNKNLLAPTDLLELFFRLLKSQDKSLRSFLQNHIVNDIKNLNSKHKNAKLNTTLQNFMFSMLKETNTKAAKMSIDIMIDLYKKNIWNDAKTVNVIATGCFSKITKVSVASLKFFLGKDEDEQDSDKSDSDEDINPKEVAMANKVNKKTRKRQKHLQKVKKLASKAYKKKSQAETFNFSAIHLIHDPQGMAEKLFKQLENSNKRFEVKLITLDVISRLIGLHNLFLFNFYPYIQRFMQPHQREVVRILQFAAQSSHELVPPDIIEPMLRTLANNFITERNSSDVIAIGLNAIKEISARCPLAMNEDLLRDLAGYKNYKDRSVMMASRVLIHLFRNIRPELLHKKDRGKPTEATEELEEIKYGKIDAKDYVVGAEVLLAKSEENVHVDTSSDSDADSDDGEWIDMPQSDEEMVESESEEVKKLNKVEHLQLKKTLAQKVTIDRLLTDEDFKKIDISNVKKQVFSSKKGLKRKAEEVATAAPSELVKLSDIENIYKKRKHDKQARIESVRKGQEGREKYGYKDGRMNENCSRTNRERNKRKNFQMIRHKVKSKAKKSFKEKQISLRNHLIKLKKMK